jgi:hypothetical protein
VAKANALNQLNGAWKMMAVYQVEGDMHVSLNSATVADTAEEMGAFLVEVALAIAHDYRNSFKTERADGDVCAAICDGFKECAAASLE